MFPLLEQLIIATTPTIVLLIFIGRHDVNEKEPVTLLIRLFLLGVVSVIPAVILEVIAEFPTYDYFDIFLYAFFGVAIIEEGVKYAAAKFALKRAKSFDEVFDGVIYCVYVSLGFATIENILYVLQYGTGTGLLRAVTAVPAHAVFAVSMGYFMGLSKSGRGGVIAKILVLLAPTLLHAIYDFILFANFEWSLLIFLPYVVWIYTGALRLIRETYDMKPFE
jgi:RsiW-degrading membrane proteinase PrsW (M82 family)